MYDDSLTDGLRNKGLNFSDFEVFLFCGTLLSYEKRWKKIYKSMIMGRYRQKASSVKQWVYIG